MTNLKMWTSKISLSLQLLKTSVAVEPRDQTI